MDGWMKGCGVVPTCSRSSKLRFSPEYSVCSRHIDIHLLKWILAKPTTATWNTRVGSNANPPWSTWRPFKPSRPVRHWYDPFNFCDVTVQVSQLGTGTLIWIVGWHRQFSRSHSEYYPKYFRMAEYFYLFLATFKWEVRFPVCLCPASSLVPLDCEAVNITTKLP